MLKNKVYNLIKLLTILFVIVITLIFSKNISHGIKNGISISINFVIPSLFIFMIISNFISNSKLKFILSKPFVFIEKHIFRIDKSKIYIFLLSILGGYPIGATILANEVKCHTISKKQAEFMLCYTINCSPAFLISGIGINKFNNYKLGLYLYISEILSCVILGFILSFFTRKEISNFNNAKLNNTKKMIPNFIESTISSIKSLGIICGFVVLFSGITEILKSLKLNQNFLNILSGILECTVGCNNTENNIFLILIFTSFGGICVLFQVFYILYKEKISLKYVLLTRPILVLLSYIFFKIFIGMDNNVLDCISINKNIGSKIYSVSPVSTMLLIIISIIMLSFNKKSVIIDTENIS